MARTCLSTTVDPQLLAGARAVRPGATDASVVDEALRALLERHRSAEVDASYAAYDEHPLDEPDERGDLASWRRALVAPCTTTLRGLVSEVLLKSGEDPVPKRCAVNLDSVESVSTALLVQRTERLADARMRQVCQALAIAVDCPG